MEAHLPGCIESFFRTHNDWDHPAHLALLAPDLVFSGSGSGIRGGGLLDYRGILRGAREELKVQWVRPIRLYGNWRFVFREDGSIQELTILWNPNGPHVF